MAKLTILATLYHRLALQFPRDESHALATLLWLCDIFQKRSWNSDLLHHFSNQIKTSLQNNLPCELAYKSYLFEESPALRYNNLNTLLNLDLDSTKIHRESSPNGEMKCFCKDASMNDDLSSSNWRVDRNRLHMKILQTLESPDDMKDNHVTLLESVEGIARNTTGLTSWGGSAVMAQWLDNSKEVRSERMYDAFFLSKFIYFLMSVHFSIFLTIINTQIILKLPLNSIKKVHINY